MRSPTRLRERIWHRPWIAFVSTGILTRNRDQAVVMISLEDYEALEETAYLLRSPANAKRLIASVEAAELGNTVVKKIDLTQ
jgi:PHD/YefM family antitoxin component YafN of YafNO toxin-antitoxin module